MARNKKVTEQSARYVLDSFLRLPVTARIALIVFVLICGAIYLAISYQPKPVARSEGEKTLVFCHWNMENLFDDINDKRSFIDEPFDNWFALSPRDRELKYQRLTDILLRFNDGIGPDIIVGNEIESYRAAELLKNSLNDRLRNGVMKYEYVAMEELSAGRHIAPCVISRYPLSGAKLLGRQQRILEVFVTINGHELHLISSHWTSQLSDKDDDDSRGRTAYATTIHQAYSDAIRKNSTVDFLVCGDFNDTPEADSVVNKLYMTGDVTKVTPDANAPRLLGLLSGKSADRYGTLYYSGRLNTGEKFAGPLIYDHIAVSPGMLDKVGWSCIVDSVEVPTEGLIRSGARTRRPWRFGTKTDDAQGRGYSDHFPVLTKLEVAP
jgi:endonuclease/exonuclease/phosphatase family metal-dependent hydrolase